MRPIPFSTDMAPPGERMALFRLGAAPYEVDAVGDPLAFRATWRALPLGDANALHATITPVRYRRTRERIERDGEDRWVVFHIRGGRAVGHIDGVAIDVGPGEGMVWDLSRPLEVTASGGLDVDAVTLPRYMVTEVMTTAPFGPVATSPALELAVAHLHYLFDHAAGIPDEGAVFQGRALRDMLAAVMASMPGADTAPDDATGPVLGRICALIDRDPGVDRDVAAIAGELGLPHATIAAVAARFGGLEELVERRRLLAAYRLLSDPGVTASVSAIAARCGFSNLPRFSRRFRHAFHTTARDLRVHHRAHLPVWAGAYHIERSYGPLMAAGAPPPPVRRGRVGRSSPTTTAG